MAVPGRGGPIAALWAALLAGAASAGADEPAAGGWGITVAPWFAVNPLFVRTPDDGGSGPLETDVTTDIATAGGSAWYRTAEWQIGRGEAGRPLSLMVEPLAGVRLNHLRTELEATLGTAGGRARRQFDGDETWVDPLVALQIVAQHSDWWAFRAEGDIGGFGVGSDFAWNAQAIVSYARAGWAATSCSGSATGLSAGTARTGISHGT